MQKYLYTNDDLNAFRDALHIIRRVQEKIETDEKAYTRLDDIMCAIEDVISDIEGNP